MGPVLSLGGTVSVLAITSHDGDTPNDNIHNTVGSAHGFISAVSKRPIYARYKSLETKVN